MAKFFSKFSENYQLINQEAHYTLSSRNIKENESSLKSLSQRYMPFMFTVALFIIA